MHAVLALVLAGLAFGADPPDWNAIEASARSSGSREAALEILERGYEDTANAVGHETPETARAASRVGAILHDLGDLERSAEFFETSVAILRETESKDSWNLGNELLNLGAVQRRLEQHPVAVETLKESKRIFEQWPEKAGMDVAANYLAGVYLDLGDNEAAFAIEEASLERMRARFGPTDPQVAQALGNLGAVARRLHRFDEAVALQLEALAILEAAYGTDHESIGHLLNNLGVAMSGAGDLHGAIESQQRAIRILEKHVGQDHPRVARSLQNLATNLQHTGQHDIALEHLRRALAIIERVHGPQSRQAQSAMATLGSALNDMGHVGEAETLLRRVLALAEPRGPSPILKRTLNNLALVRLNVGDLAGGVALAERSLSVTEALVGPDHPDSWTIHMNLGISHFKNGAMTVGRTHVERAVEIVEKAHGPEHRDTAQALSALGALAAESGDFLRAESLARRVLEIRKVALGPETPRTQLARRNLAVALSRIGRHEEAYALVKHVLDYRGDRASAQLIQAVASTAFEVGRKAEAEALYERALTAIDPSRTDVGAAQFRAMYGTHLSNTGQYEGAAEQIRRAISDQEASAPGNLQRLSNFYTRLAIAEHNLDGDGGRAAASRSQELSRRFVMDVLPGLGEREALAFVANERMALDGYLRVWDRPDDTQTAWDATVFWKGVASRLLRARRDALFASGDSTVQEQLDRLVDTQRQIATLVRSAPSDTRTSRLQSLTTSKEELERALATSEAWAQHRANLYPDAADICAAIPDGAVLIDVIRRRAGEDFYFTAFVVGSGSCDAQRVDLGPAVAIEGAVGEFNQMLASDALTARIDARGRAVSALVWDPLIEAIGDAKRVLVAPDGAIANLAFGALIDADGAYLLESIEFLYVDTAADLIRSFPAVPTEGLLVVGDVEFGGAESANHHPLACGAGAFAPLPHTASELHAVARLWRKRDGRVVTLSGTAASEGRVAEGAAGKRAIHLATHGFFATGACRSALDGGGELAGYNPMTLAGLVLAGANTHRDPLNPDDGIWTASEVALLNLQGTQLVVLSACDSGLGSMTTGEGTMGLRRAFSSAGVQTLVTSLWSIEDAATEALMTEFYLALRRRPPAAALRRAQLQILERNRREFGQAHPQDWAAFIAAGQVTPE